MLVLPILSPVFDKNGLIEVKNVLAGVMMATSWSWSRSELFFSFNSLVYK